MPAPAVYIGYSHKDRKWLDKLTSQLAFAEAEGDLAVWDDSRLEPGTQWREAIRQAIEGAQAAVLLVSPDFLASAFTRSEEVAGLLERRSREGVPVIPVIVRACDWQVVPWLARLQVRPADGRPLAALARGRREDEIAAIVREVRQLLRSPQAAPSRPGASAIQAEPPAALHQLPPLLSDIVGRDEELAEIEAAVRRGGATLCGIRGQAGVGKTALALKLAQRLSPLFPDAQIYLSLQGLGEKPLASTQAMAHVLHSFHPAVQLPTGEAELIGLYRSVLEGKRVLLLMDDAAHQEQIEPLIPPRGCVLLVTTRAQLTLPGMVVRDLDKLTREEGRELLLDLAPWATEQADEIVRYCDGLPLALRLVGGMLTASPHLSPGESVHPWVFGQEVLGLEGALAASYQQLPDDLRRMWRGLAVFLGTFDGKAAAAIWGCDPTAGDEALQRFGKKGLVEWNADRFELHGLARTFAARRLQEEGPAEVRRRHAEHYLEVLASAESLLRSGGEALLAGLRLFDLEWENIQAGQAWAAQRAADDEDAARLCSRYPEEGANCLQLRQLPRDRIRWLEAALLAARRVGDASAEGRHLGNLGLAYSELGEMAAAQLHFEQHLAIARQLGDRSGEGVALGNLGITFAKLGRSGEACQLFERHLTVSRASGDRRGEAAALGNLGLAYLNAGDARRAIEFSEQHLQVIRSLGDRLSESSALGNLGSAYMAAGQARRAMAFFEQWLQIARELGDRRAEGYALGDLGAAYADLGETHRAVALYEQQLQIAQEIGDPRGMSFSLGRLGAAYAELGETRRAIELYEQCLVIAREMGDRHREEVALGSLGLTYAAQGDYDRAIALYQQHLQIAQEIGDRRGEAVAMGNLGNAFAARGDTRQAISAYESYREASRLLGDRAAEVIADWNLGLQYEQEGQFEKAAELMQSYVDYARAIGHAEAEIRAARVERLRERARQAELTR